MSSSLNNVTVQAPGKLFLLGEYAVLFGGPAIVMAVNRYVRVNVAAVRDGVTTRSRGAPVRALHATWRQDELCFDRPDEQHRLITTVLDALSTNDILHPALPGLEIVIDSRELFEGHTKLGLGSSAAVAHALTLGVVEFAKNYGVTHALDEGFVFNTHHEYQRGQGSGADVGAGYCGGHFMFQRNSEHVLPQTSSMTLPDDLHCRYIWVGQPASTQSALTILHDYQAHHPGRFTQAISPLLALAQQGINALVDVDTDKFLSVCEAYCHNLSEFGRSVGVDIVSAPHFKMLILAQKLDLAYKPSGAGNGDFGLVFGKDINALDRFVHEAAVLGGLAMDLAPGRACHVVTK